MSDDVLETRKCNNFKQNPKPKPYTETLHKPYTLNLDDKFGKIKCSTLSL